MGVVFYESTVRHFVEDDGEFKKSVAEKFAALDLNGDGVLSRGELRKAFGDFSLIETHFGSDLSTTPEQLTKLYDSIFDKFDCDNNQTVDLEEFGSETKKIMLAIADELVFFPIVMAFEDDDQSFLKKAADLEASQILPIYEKLMADFDVLLEPSKILAMADSIRAIEDEDDDDPPFLKMPPQSS